MTSRRDFLMLAAGLAALPARGAPDAMHEAIGKVTRGAAVKPGRVKLELPPLIDNGNTVPLSVAVESPMSAAEHVRAIHVFTERNPQPYVLSAYLGPRAGRASIATRVRIANSGTVTAIAELSDGSFWSDAKNVVVVLSACLEGPV
jgi:sulfur-oxidizing protein SoxY